MFPLLFKVLIFIAPSPDVCPELRMLSTPNVNKVLPEIVEAAKFVIVITPV